MGSNKNYFVGELFTPTRGKGKYTRKYAEGNPGEYPIYSASLASPLAFVNEYDYDGTYLTWTTNGYGGRIQIISGKFCINGDRGILIPKLEKLPDLDYLKYILEPILIDQAVGRIVDGMKNEYTKVSPEIVAKSIIVLPKNDQDELNYELINAHATKIKKIETLQLSLKKHLDIIENVEINIPLKSNSKSIFLENNEYFALTIGERVLKKNSLSEGIPVYSANVNTPFAFIKKSNISNFEKASIIWGIDGVFSWNIIPEGKIFATTDHCGRLEIKDLNLDPEYIYYYLQASRLDYGFDRTFRANLDNVGRVVELKIPVNSKGNFCIKTQKEIANRYKNINIVKSKIIEKLALLNKTKIDIAL